MRFELRSAGYILSKPSIADSLKVDNWRGVNNYPENDGYLLMFRQARVGRHKLLPSLASHL